jgi:hypothetical protein
MGEVIKLEFNTTLDISAQEMLEEIAKQKPKNAFVVVWPEDGTMPTYHCSTGDIPVVLMRVNEFIHKYYNGDFTE